MPLSPRQHSTLEQRELLTMASELASRAAHAIMAIYRDGFLVRAKADSSPVTIADESAEQIITEGLRGAGIKIVAEEAVARGEAPSLDGGPYWLIDPLDGTREFIDRNGEFTVNVALIEQGRPSIGVIEVPAIGTAYRGIVGVGAERRRAGGGWEPIAARPPADEPILLASRSHMDDATQSFIEKQPSARVEICGSSVKFCRIAEGSADIYPRFGPTMEWDVAAGDAILSAAGGSVRSPDGTVLLYGRTDFRCPAFIARGLTR